MWLQQAVLNRSLNPPESLRGKPIVNTMSTAPTEFVQLMQQVKAGSEQAARELLDRYGEHILRAIRRRLGRRMRSQFDSADFLQAVWASFYAHQSWLSRFHRPEALIAFLARVATNKVISQCRSWKKRQHYQALELHIDSGSKGGGIQRFPNKKQPTPSQLAIAKETCERLVRDDPRTYRRVMELRIAGLSYTQIAQEVEMHEAKVRRIVRVMERRYREEERPQ